MERFVDLKEISDGKLYGANDLVRADTGGCSGCSACCRGMGTSIVLDPYDIMCLCRGLSLDFAGLLAGPVELNVQDGLILPNLKMDPATDRCSFLNEEGLCGIHNFRPGFCRLFPLGRYYDGEGFSYFLQTRECPKPGKAKVKVRKWLDIPDFTHYEIFIRDWHYFLKQITGQIAERQDEAWQKQISVEILQRFYVQPYATTAGFYEQIEKRISSLTALR